MIRVCSAEAGAVERLKPAFRRCMGDYDLMLTEIEAGRVSVYQVKDEHHDLMIAGEICGKSYFLWGVVGRGVVSGITELAYYVTNAGFESITAETFFKGLPKLCRDLNITTKPIENGAKLLEMRVKNGRF